MSAGWRPVKEGPPPKSGRYLCTFAGRRNGEAVDVLAYDAAIGAWTGPWWKEGTLVAWRPLPAPWEGPAPGGVEEGPRPEEKKAAKPEPHVFCAACSYLKELDDGYYCMDKAEPWAYHKKSLPGRTPGCSEYWKYAAASGFREAKA